MVEQKVRIKRNKQTDRFKKKGIIFRDPHAKSGIFVTDKHRPLRIIIIYRSLSSLVSVKMGLYSDIDYEKGTRTTICRRAQLKLSASSRWQDLSVTRLCHLKCFCQLKRLRLWAPPSVRTCARSWVFSHTAAESSYWTSSILWGRDIEEALQRVVSFQICTVTNKIIPFKREYGTQKKFKFNNIKTI